jgi:hypothetical protein
MSNSELDAFVRGSLPPVIVPPARERRLIAAVLIRLGRGVSAPPASPPVFLATAWASVVRPMAVPLTAFAALGVVVGTTIGLSDPARGISHLIVSFATTLTGF